ncbi:MAG: sensor histidine kinase [Lachnospiraceae bacterium]|nr:sensor histidine kinase [Lachnospiraceae bacterium]
MIKRILDKTLLFCIGTFLILCQGITTDLVAVWLVSLTIMALGLYFDTRQAVIVLMLLYGVLCLFLPPLFLFLPVICYDGLWYRCLWCYAYVLLVIARWDSYPEWIWLIAALGMLTSGLLSYGTQQSQMLSQELIRLRDTTTERDILQQARAREMLEKQDYEIYLATLKERNRIAREIHDNVGHMLSRSILQVGALGTIYKEEPLHGQLHSVNETLNEAMTSIRRSVHDLHDDAIDLEQAVRDSIRDMQEKYRVTLEYDMSRHVPREVKYCFIAIAKEAVSNIVKHSDADTVTFRFREHPAFYQMLIEDNGTVSHGDGEGIGLKNMRERVQNLGGTLHIHRENGFHIFVAIQKKEDTTCES